MDTEKLRELVERWRAELPYKGSAWEERHDIIKECADDLDALLAAQPPKAEAEVEVFVDSLGCQRSRVRWADGELDPPPRLAHGTKLYTATPTAAADVAEVERVARHIALSVEYIEKQYPDAKLLDRGPILRNMRRWSANLLTALRTFDADRNQEAGVGAEFGSMRTRRAIRALQRLREADDHTLRVIANALDLPVEDGGVAFMLDAFDEAESEIEVELQMQRAEAARKAKP